MAGRLYFCTESGPKKGKQVTKTMDCQMRRWQPFVEKWSNVKGKKAVALGDFDFDCWSSSGSQLHLRSIKDEVFDNMINGGYQDKYKVSN